MKKLIVCVLLVGCGGDDGGGGGFVELDNLGLEIGMASCRVQFECCTDAEIMQQYMGITHDGHPITTEEECVAFANAVYTSLAITRYKESIAVGRSEYDGAAAADCVDAIANATCAEYSMQMISATSGCRPFVLPKVADGGACTQDTDCTSDNCEGATVPISGPSTDGMCKPIPGDGQSCDDNCTDGLYCGSSQSSSGDICQPLKADGAQCNVRRECASDYCNTTTRMCEAKPLTCDGP